MSRFSIEKSSVSVETFLGETFCAVFRNFPVCEKNYWREGG